MRYLIVLSVLAYAAAVPAGPAVIPEPTQATISAGDINGAVIEAQVEAADSQVEAANAVIASVDASRQITDQTNELQGQAANNADENAWKAVDDVKTIEARLDGAAAASARLLAKQLVGRIAPGAAPVVPTPYTATVSPYPTPVPVSRYTPAAAATAPVASYAPAPYSYPYASPYNSAYNPAYNSAYASPYASPYVNNPYYSAPYSYPGFSQPAYSPFDYQQY